MNPLETKISTFLVTMTYLLVLFIISCVLYYLYFFLKYKPGTGKTDLFLTIKDREGVIELERERIKCKYIRIIQWGELENGIQSMCKIEYWY